MNRISETPKLPCIWPLIHLLAADRGGPGCREILGMAGIVDQDDLLLDLLAGAEVVVLCGVGPAGRRSRPGSGR